jgi:hypothetical protein
MPLWTQEELVGVLKTADPDISGERINSILQKYGALSAGDVSFEAHTKDTMPAAGRPGPGGRVYDGGPFSAHNSTILNGIPRGGSPLARWLPTSKIKARYNVVNHMEYVAPKDFDPASETYQQWLNGLSIPVCGYGPSATWSGFAYQQAGGSFSFSTEQMKIVEDGGLPYYEDIELFVLEANGQRTQITNDADWAVAILIRVAESHVDWVLINGRKDNSDMEFDGLMTQITEGYIASKIIGRGIPHWPDPYVTDGAALVTASAVLAQLHINVRVVMNRIKLLNWNLSPGDLVVAMHPSMWDNLAEHIAAGAFDRYTNAYNFDGTMSQIEFMNRLDGIRATKSMSIDGFLVPVLEDTHLAASSTVDSAPAVTGDIGIFVRAAGGFVLLKQEWLDWSELQVPAALVDSRLVIQNGFARTGWVTEASKCYYYFLEMFGRVASKMHNFQGRLNSVSVPVLSGDEVLSGSFTSPDFAPLKYHGSLDSIG